ncbi:DUF4091 domain-containing protein [bacterium]|nr:DUF4091 domain-containing protein [bacterium]
MKCVWSIARAIAVLAFAGPAAHAEYLVGLTHGTAKQRPEFSFEAADNYALQSARREWEPFQILVRDDAGATVTDVVVSDFVGPGDPMPAELYRVHYVPVTPDRISSFPPDPAKAGDWPDGLVPFEDHFVGEARGALPFDVPPDYTMAIFGDVFVPIDQAPGTYEAMVTVVANGRADWHGTLTLTVWDFVLPGKNTLAGAYGFSRGTACNWHANHGGVSDCDTLIERYYEEFARHRIGLDRWSWGNPTYAWNDDAQTFDWDWTWFDDRHGPYFDGTFYDGEFRFDTYQMPGAPGGRPGNVDAADWEREFWAGWATHFRDKGWIEALFYYLPDEPDPSEYPALRDLAARLHNADPDLQPMATEQFEPGLAGDIDIWTPDQPLFSDSLPMPPYPEDYADRRALGEKTWWYNCVSAISWFDYANHFVDFESSYQRIWTWLTRRYDFEGLLFWHTVYVPGKGLDPWDSQYAPPFAQGDGNLIYPGTVDRIGGTTDIPVASLRMKYMRESMEDYEYLHILDERGDGDWVDGVVRTVAPKTFQWERDWRAMLGWRERVAKKILGTLDETPPAPPASLTATGQVEAIELSWMPPGDADLAGYEIWYGIYSGDAYFGGAVDAGASAATIEGLAAGRTYRAWVHAFDVEGNRSAASDIVTATTLAGGDDDAADAGDDDAATNDEDERHNPNGVSVESSGGQDDFAAEDDDEAASGACGCGV